MNEHLDQDEIFNDFDFEDDMDFDIQDLEAEVEFDYYDDDPNPYHGDYSEE